MRRLRLALVLTLLATPVAAQIQPGDQGLQLVTLAGTAGTLCRGFSCVPHQATAGVQETVTLEVRGPRNAAYVLLVAPRAQLCLKVPGLEYSLVLSPPWIPALAGTLSQQDTLRVCPGGLAATRFVVPLPAQARVAMQAVVMADWLNGPRPTFTATIEVAMQ
jgi:hypothetical protein